nr:hypothetical protein [Tanacetum cinerariifolium]
KSDDDKTSSDSGKGSDSKQDSDGSESDFKSDQQEYDDDVVKDDHEDDDDKFEGDEDRGMDSDDVQDKKTDVEMTDETEVPDASGTRLLSFLDGEDFMNFLAILEGTTPVA